MADLPPGRRPGLDPDECRRRFGASEHAYLATVGPDGAPHLVPVVFDLTDDRITVAVDHKPKRTTALQRLRNIAADPRVTLLADHWSTDWQELWWVRADGEATVVDSGREHEAAVRRLQRRYAQYVTTPPRGPVILTVVHRWTGWEARS
ncbi:TIGR03668 family PPOX class F420-dependent oxidoreductase [Actinotalea sp. K2]|uniref:TIGR03668 family PPOX class F420-dependent oxidoreductase n=1 Tax=Actinotalea sp. K2 TaxID=2939438 RepID=UPI0020173735|nr:TIGR03668 family PPOX class F420-dependent oxidoreductase [Actinotalea sp. K2]MCL3862505.1 TIGR03668 family PPOX class F420-dependent oxidoreductase [Actinotalea sp. K2]